MITLVYVYYSLYLKKGINNIRLEIKKKSLQIFYFLIYLVHDHSLFIIYFNSLFSILILLLNDAIPEIRYLTARSIGNISQFLDMNQKLFYIQHIFHILISTSSSVEKSGVALCLSSILSKSPEQVADNFISKIIHMIDVKKYMQMKLKRGNVCVGKDKVDVNRKKEVGVKKSKLKRMKYNKGYTRNGGVDKEEYYNDDDNEKEDYDDDDDDIEKEDYDDNEDGVEREDYYDDNDSVEKEDYYYDDGDDYEEDEDEDEEEDDHENNYNDDTFEIEDQDDYDFEGDDDEYDNEYNPRGNRKYRNREYRSNGVNDDSDDQGVEYDEEEEEEDENYNEEEDDDEEEDLFEMYSDEESDSDYYEIINNKDNDKRLYYLNGHYLMDKNEKNEYIIKVDENLCNWKLIYDKNMISSASSKEGLIGFFIYMPECEERYTEKFLKRILQKLILCLNDTNENVRDITLRACKILISIYSKNNTSLILKYIENKIYNNYWRIRKDCVILLNVLIEKNLQINKEERDFELLNTLHERFYFMLSIICIMKNDKNINVRQTAYTIYKNFVNKKLLQDMCSILLKKITQNLSSKNNFKQLISALSLGDLVYKTDARQLESILEHMVNEFKTTKFISIKKGISLGFYEIFSKK